MSFSDTSAKKYYCQCGEFFSSVEDLKWTFWFPTPIFLGYFENGYYKLYNETHTDISKPNIIDISSL